MNDFIPHLYLATSFWIGITTLVIAAIGGTVTAIGQHKAAEATEDAGKAQREAAMQDARNKELQAAENAKRERLNHQRDLARMRARQAGNGLTMDGSQMDVFAETSGRLELGVQDKARADALDAQNLRSAGDMALWEAGASAAAQRISSYGTLLTTAGGAAGSYYKNKPTTTT